MGRANTIESTFPASKNTSKGYQAEELVFSKLEKKGWQLYQQNFRTPFAEIDIIVFKVQETRLRFLLVEVKTLSRWDFIEARLSQRQKLRIESAQLYLQEFLHSEFQGKTLLGRYIDSAYRTEVELSLAFVRPDGGILFLPWA